jgi:colanic acid biosynthesis protein WcaH
LVATDLFLMGERSNKILLGLRTNAPAKNFWFVPGRRIRKNESIDDSLNFVVAKELGMNTNLAFNFFGTATHIYEENYYQDPSFNTHYIILSYLAKISESTVFLPDSQHTHFKFWEFEAALNSPFVHQYTKAYILKIINLRENSLW